MNWLDEQRTGGFDDWHITDMMTNTIFAALHTSSQASSSSHTQLSGGLTSGFS